MGTIKLTNVNKIYPNGVQAVFDFNMEIKDGEFIVLVGPSGCGKSTLLRMIAGLEEISSGEMTLDGKIINDLAPKDRDIAMVFQNYALYPQMTVYHNMAFSLVLRKEDTNYIHERVVWAADVLGLTKQLNRRPNTLSGGQRQRVALGRAIVRDPKIFLLDEPLSNLDAKLRASTRKEIKHIHNSLKTTMIYVTHDQIEALTLADRIVILRHGYVQQIGTPYEVYHDPANRFVANFIGTPPMNIIDAVVNNKGELCMEDIKLDVKSYPIFEELKRQNLIDKTINIGIRPEQFIITDIDESCESHTSTVTVNELLGYESLIHFTIGDMNVIGKTDQVLDIEPGEPIRYQIALDKVYYFNKETGERIYG